MADLTAFEGRRRSQNGEDGVIAEILRRIGTTGRWFVDFGASTGAETNCALLADVLGWSGLFIEPGDYEFGLLSSKYRGSRRVRTEQALVGPDNVESLFRAAGVPDEPDVLSIDIDGGDYYVWEAIESFRPRLVVIEYNSALDPQRRLVQPRDAGRWEHTTFYGASLGAMRALGAEKGYRLVHTELSGNNAFFVREELAEPLPAGDDVPWRAPNYTLQSWTHPADPKARTFLDLDG
jgi:hypothetical protein